MVLYCDGVYGLTEADYRMLFDRMPLERQQRIRRYRRREDRILGVCAYGLLVYMLDWAGVPTAELSLSHNAHGKPLVPGADFHFNLSHTADAVACGLAREPVGVDIQRLICDYGPVVRRGCTPAEIRSLAASAAPGQDFTRLWTLKESYVKCRGTGIWEPLTELDFSQVAFPGGTCLEHCFSLAQEGSLFLAACTEHQRLPIQKIPFSDVLRHLYSNSQKEV